MLVTVGAGRQKTKTANAKRKPRKQAKTSKPKREKAAPKNKGGRPFKDFPLEEVVRLAKTGMPLSGIAESLGTSVQTLDNRRTADPAFAEALDRARREGTGKYDEELFKAYNWGIKHKVTRIVQDAMAHWRLMHGERPMETPLLLEIPLPGNCTLLVPEGIDPVEAINRRNAIQEIQSTEP